MRPETGDTVLDFSYIPGIIYIHIGVSFRGLFEMTLTPLLPMEPEMKKRVDSYIEKLIVPKEQDQNRMSVGGLVHKDYSYCLWMPHNYRLYFDFSKENLKLPSDNETEGQTSVWRYVNKKEISFDSFMDCRVVIKQSQIEITNKINPRWYRLSMATERGIQAQFQEIISKKDKECREVLGAFIAKYGGSSAYQVLNARSEDKVMNEEMIDKIPLKMAFHTDIVKKVYNEHNVEFKGPGAAANYMSNRILEKVCPDISEALRELATAQINQEKQALVPLTEQIKLHLEVQRKTLSVLDQMNTTLKDISQEKRLDRIKDIKKQYGW
jgi:hypothetical protein